MKAPQLICDNCGKNNFVLIWNVNKISIQKCTNCGLVSANVNYKDLENLYEKDYYTNVYPDYESDRDTHNKTNSILLNEIEKFFSPGSMIEIGSAFGFFIESALKKGWKVTGFETSQYASSLARNRDHLNILNEDFLSANIDSKVDLICMFDTIEHLYKPSLYIEKIASVLKKGGGLVLTPGDFSSLMAKVQGKKWRMVVPPLHVYYYTPATLQYLLNRYGFKILSIKYPPKWQNLNSIVKFQFGIEKNKFPSIPIKLNFYDIMMVIAQKE